MDIFISLFPESWPDWFRIALSAAIPAVLLLTFMALGPIVYVYAERKIAGFMQDRLGPTRVGPYGLLQTIADAIKLMFKEAIYPLGADKKLFLIAPCLVVLGAFLSFVVIPFGSRLQAADLSVGVFYVVAVSSLSTVGLIMAGWASNNKYALFGAMRSAAQIVSYEIPAVMTLLTIVMIVGSLSLQDIVWAQTGGLTHWFLFRYFPLMPIAFLIFFTAGLAECNRTPFDIPEAESELVAGFHTEYSGFFFAMFFMAEYTEMFVISSVASVLFLGGWWTPFPNKILQHIGPIGLGPVWLIAKAWFLVFVMMWLRWTLPRLRVDQLMHVAWKVLLPISMVLVVAVGGLLMIPATRDGFPWDRYVGWVATLLVFGALVAWMAGARLAKRRRVRDLAA
ncbi:MAG: NADH-quinone oxidoreductase subunit NuoH [Acidobacteria bacterium]|nr:MAG: NADH-quinone oxidoreductase subunit NuoH [Acidobacteriota bacterium]